MGHLRDVTYEDSGGSVHIVVESSQLVRTVAKGYAREGMVTAYLRELLLFSNAATHRMDVFHDWAALDGFAPEARRLFLQQSSERRAKNALAFRGFHLLVSSTLVQLALEAARVWYGDAIHVYRDRETFELTLSRVRREPSKERIAPKTEAPPR